MSPEFDGVSDSETLDLMIIDENGNILTGYSATRKCLRKLVKRIEELREKIPEGNILITACVTKDGRDIEIVLSDVLVNRTDVTLW